MKITIQLPNEFVGHWESDRFKDSLERLRVDAHCLAGRYECELVNMLIEAFQDAEVNTEDASPVRDPSCDTCYFRGKEKMDEPCWKCSYGTYLQSADMYIHDPCPR